MAWWNDPYISMMPGGGLTQLGMGTGALPWAGRQLAPLFQGGLFPQAAKAKQVGGTLPLPDPQRFNVKPPANPAFNSYWRDRQEAAAKNRAQRIGGAFEAAGMPSARTAAIDRVRAMNNLPPAGAPPMNLMPAAPAPAPQKQGIGARIGNALGNPYLGLGIMEMAKPASQRSYGPMQAGIQHMQGEQRRNTFADYLENQDMAEEAALVRSGAATPGEVWKHISDTRAAAADARQQALENMWDQAKHEREEGEAERDIAEGKREIKARVNYASDLVEDTQEAINSTREFLKKEGAGGGVVQTGGQIFGTKYSTTRRAKIKGIQVALASDKIQKMREMGVAPGTITENEWTWLGATVEALDPGMGDDYLEAAFTRIESVLDRIDAHARQMATEGGVQMGATYDDDDVTQFIPR